MAGITNGRPELAVGEPIRLGTNNEFEIEQHPVSDRLIIRDTQNGKVAYVRRERGGQIGGDGVLVKALKESKPMNDTGRTYETIQQAERKASSWVFVPPGTYNESVEINTTGLTLHGCGYNTLIHGREDNAITIEESGITIQSLSVETNTDTDIIYGILASGVSDCSILDVTVRDAEWNGIRAIGEGNIVSGCVVESVFDRDGINLGGDDSIVSNCITKSGVNRFGILLNTDSGGIVVNCQVIEPGGSGLYFGTYSSKSMLLSNRVIGAGNRGIHMDGSDHIVANNRISDSTNDDISDDGTNMLLQGNLTGASN